MSNRPTRIDARIRRLQQPLHKMAQYDRSDMTDALAIDRSLDLQEIVEWLNATGKRQTIIYLPGAAIRVSRTGAIHLVTPRAR